MSHETVQSPLVTLRKLLRSTWNSTLTIYYANSMSWRALKSGALFFLGFFLWAGSNIMLAYLPGWTWLHYPMAYGFVLIVYGPFHHLVVIPLALRWRRSSGLRQRIGRRLPNSGLVFFLVLVVVLGTFPVGPTTIDLSSSLESSGADISPDMHCVKHVSETGSTSIHCHLAEARGVDRVVVRSGQDRVLVDREPPFEWMMETNELNEVTGQQRFTVELLDENGDLIRRYTRTVSMIESGD